MPLLLLGLILLIGILIYAIYVYRHGPVSPENREKSGRPARSSRREPESPEQKVLYFPTDNIEVEKRKRNI